MEIIFVHRLYASNLWNMDLLSDFELYENLPKCIVRLWGRLQVLMWYKCFDSPVTLNFINGNPSMKDKSDHDHDIMHELRHHFGSILEVLYRFCKLSKTQPHYQKLPEINKQQSWTKMKHGVCGL